MPMTQAMGRPGPVLVSAPHLPLFLIFVWPMHFVPVPIATTSLVTEKETTLAERTAAKLTTRIGTSQAADREPHAPGHRARGYVADDRAELAEQGRSPRGVTPTVTQATARMDPWCGSPPRQAAPEAPKRSTVPGESTNNEVT